MLTASTIFTDFSPGLLNDIYDTDNSKAQLPQETQNQRVKFGDIWTCRSKLFPMAEGNIYISSKNQSNTDVS